MRTRAGPRSRMQLVPYPRTSPSAPVRCLHRIVVHEVPGPIPLGSTFVRRRGRYTDPSTYAQIGDAEAAEHVVAIETLERIAGRGGETAYMHLDVMEWDVLQDCPTTDILQTKSSKLKKVPFPAGIDRRHCWILKFGDYLALCGGRLKHTPGEATWLFPELMSVKNPSKKLTEYLRAVNPVERGGLAKFKEVAIDTLPDGACAGGIRPGVCNHLTCLMPAEMVVAMTGHDLRGVSALYEYVDAQISMCMAGAIVLAGFPPPPWGQLSVGPCSPSLKALEPLGITIQMLDPTMDAVFSLDSASSPRLRVGGSLRRLVNACFAAMLMYHEERLEPAPGSPPEMRVALNKLEACTRKKYQLAPTGNARNTIIMWGRAIMAKFQLDNARLFGRTSDSGFIQMAESIRTLGRLNCDLKQMLLDQSRALGLLNREVASLKLKLGTSPTAELVPISESGTSTSVPISESEKAVAEEEEEEEANPLKGYGSLMPDSSVAMKAGEAMKGNSVELVLKFCQNGGEWAGLNKQQAGKVRELVAWFKAAATEDEVQLLETTTTETGVMRNIIDTCNTMIRRRLATEHRDRTGKIPTALKPGKILAATGIAAQLAALAKLKENPVVLTIELAELPRFRRQQEAETAAMGGRVSSPTKVEAGGTPLTGVGGIAGAKAQRKRPRGQQSSPAARSPSSRLRNGGSPSASAEHED